MLSKLNMFYIRGDEAALVMDEAAVGAEVSV